MLFLCSALEELDATYDSDNEADYTKMDMVRVCSVHGCVHVGVGAYMCAWVHMARASTCAICVYASMCECAWD